MSYILDALRRADAERERGEVPGLQSQQQHATLDDEEASAGRPRWMLGAIVALALALAVAIGWNFIGGEPPRSRLPAETIAAAPVVSPVTAPVVAPALAPVLAPIAVPAPVAVPVPAAVAVAVPAPVPAPAPMLVPKRVAPRVAASAPLPATPAPALGKPAPENRIYAQAELPDDVRRDLPKVAIGGASYSSDAASRMVIINGQVFHEGDKIAANLVLEKIKLKAAVLAYKGWRYQLDY